MLRRLRPAQAPQERHHTCTTEGVDGGGKAGRAGASSREAFEGVKGRESARTHLAPETSRQAWPRHRWAWQADSVLSVL